jgi:hypothetical protein
MRLGGGGTVQAMPGLILGYISPGLPELQLSSASLGPWTSGGIPGVAQQVRLVGAVLPCCFYQPAACGEQQWVLSLTARQVLLTTPFDLFVVLACCPACCVCCRVLLTEGLVVACP